MVETQEILQKNIDTKTKELADLKTKILTENQTIKRDELKKQETKLKEEIQVLHKELDELKKVEDTTTIDTTKEEEDKLKNNIDKYRIYNIMKDSTMGKKLKEILTTDEKVKEFAEDIYTVVDKFIDQELE